MYCDHIDHLAVCPLPDALRNALGLLTDFALLPPGHYPIDGTRLFALVQEMETGYAEERLFEAHARYLDVQYLVSGVERIGYLPRGSEVRLHEDRLEESDIALYDSPQAASELLLTPGMYAVFEAGELHRPCCAVASPAPIRKVVLKLRQGEVA
ncbi:MULTISPECIES: YhcH/YjgK/YiaL family protein [unclassified Paludibacterium]|uniref:YhcH/YjgK/YiaL family protein n=1 Tax=unclassified Paludibacterium TaxID=2618429 RepID=UPI001C04E138|nr:YhcH/YjgK/YiaL family protein [Paludibacterium sp. B53371]BEV71665.1 YhcH/YjgK/YiaL family protein [Paludibacterium sp. THUN1379]